MKFACYLDEIDDDPIAACAAAAALKIKNVCLRRVWATNVAAAADQACQALLMAVKKHKLEVTAICTDVGGVTTNVLTDERQRLKRTILIAAYFRAPLLRVFAGRTGNGDANSEESIKLWLQFVESECSAHSVVPIVEIEPDAAAFDLDNVVRLFTDHQGIKWLYDPAALVARRNQNPLLYWDKLKSRAAAIDLRDFAVGIGYRPIGHGNCRWNEINVDGFDGWFLLEPGLGRRYGSAYNRKDAFSLALEAARRLPFIHLER